MITKLKSPKLTVPRSYMEEVGDRIMNMIKQDCSRGLGQDGKNFPSYRSAQYKKYKNNYMKRFTTMNGPKRKHRAGTNLKSLGGISVIDNTTTHVTMTLTGALLDGLHSIPFDNAVVTAYKEGDKEKIFGNEDYGRNIVGLRNPNQDVILKMVTDYLFKNVDDWAREDIVITVSK